MRRIAGLRALLLLVCLSTCAGGAAADVPPPFEPLSVTSSAGAVEIGLWGRRYRFEAGPLPTQIESQGVPLLVAAPRFEASLAGEIDWQPPKLIWARPDAVRLRSIGTLAGAQVYGETDVEYDGMIAVRLALTAQRDLIVERLVYELPLAAGAARFFSHHLPYDYQLQNVDKTRLLEAAGTLPADGLALGFVPSLALGNREVGVEWWSETDARWSPSSGVPPFRVSNAGGAVRLRVTPIAAPLALAEGEVWRDAFALFVFPARPPPERWRSVRFLPYGRVTSFDPSVGTRFVFVATHETFQALYDGLPASDGGTLQRALRSDLARLGVSYVPWSKLTLAPALHPATMSHFPDWSANGRWWRLPEQHDNLVIQRTHPELGAGDPYTYPVCAARRDYFDWLLAEDLATLENERLDGFYFDHGGITRMCEANPILAGAPGRESWEYRNVRAFYKRLYESVKAVAPDALIVIHTHGTPKALGAFVDFHMFGEALNVVFAGGHTQEEYRADPSLYTPDYAALPRGYLAAQLDPPVGGVASVIPQVRWAVDPDHPERARGFQRVFHAILLSNDAHAPIWLSDTATADALYRTLDRFGDLGAAVAHPAWASRWLIRRPPGMRAAAWVRDGRALLVLANLGDAPLGGRVQLDLHGLAVPLATRWVDLERSGSQGALVAGALEVEVPARDLRVLLVE